MLRKKIILFGGAVILIIFVIFLKFIFAINTSSDIPDLVTDLPNKENVDIPRETVTNAQTLTIQTPEGGVLLNDSRTFENTSEMGSGIFSITTLENENPISFGIIFNENNGSFAIGLEKEPISKARLDAQEYLKGKLNLSEESLCSLNIFVGVPNRVNQFFSGQNLGLSFCPGSVSLE